jgi:hypothetical protein
VPEVRVRGSQFPKNAVQVQLQLQAKVTRTLPEPDHGQSSVGRGLHFPTCALQNEPLHGSNSNEMGKAISDLTKTLITCPFWANFCVLGLHFDRKPCRCGCSVACSDLQVTRVDHYMSFQLFFISASRQLACGLSYRQPIKKR